jgi:N-methylhydantoinase A
MTKDALAVVKPALKGQAVNIQRIADCRYVGQGHEIRITVPVRRLTQGDGAKLRAEFERLYRQIYGLTIEGMEAEAITWSVTASSRAEPAKRAKPVKAAAAPKPKAKRKVYDAALGKMVDTPVYWRFDMMPGARIKGPAIIAEDETSTIVGANFSARIDSLGYIVLEKKG